MPCVRFFHTGFAPQKNRAKPNRQFLPGRKNRAPAGGARAYDALALALGLNPFGAGRRCACPQPTGAATADAVTHPLSLNRLDSQGALVGSDEPTGRTPSSTGKNHAPHHHRQPKPTHPYHDLRACPNRMLAGGLDRRARIQSSRQMWTAQPQSTGKSCVSTRRGAEVLWVGTGAWGSMGVCARPQTGRSVGMGGGRSYATRANANRRIQTQNQKENP